MFDPSNAQMYAPGTTVGGTPQAGGYMPNTTEMMQGNMRLQQDARLQAYLLQNDARSRHMAQIAANAIGGRQGGAQWMRENGQMTAQLAGMAINNQAVAGIMGGSILDMYSGVNTALSASGASRLNMGGGASTMYGGAGYVNDQVARITMMRMQDNFYNDRGGAWLHKTAGLNRSELGELTQYMGVAGAFTNLGGGGASMMRVQNETQRKMMYDAAMRAGNKTLARDLKALEGADWTKEQNVMDVDKATTDAFNKKVEAGAKALGAVKDIFGNQGVPKLMQIAKEISGMDMSSVEGSREIIGRMGRIKTFAAMHGMSAEAVGLEQSKIAAGLGGGAFGAYGSEIVQRYGQVAYDNMRGQRGGTTITRDQVMGFLNAGINSMVNKEESSRAQVAAMHLMTDKSMSSENRALLRKKMDELDAVGDDIQKQGVATRALNDSIYKVSGLSREDVLTAGGGFDSLKDDKNITQSLVERKMVVAQMRTRKLLPAILKKSGIQSTGMLDLLSSAKGDLSGSNFEKLLDAMGSEPTTASMDAAKAVIAGSQLDDKRKAGLTAMLESASLNKQDWAKARFAGGNLDAKKHKELVGLTPLETSGIETMGALGTMLAETAFGTDYGGNPNDIIGNIVAGMQGQRQVRDTDKMAYLHGLKKTIEIGEFDPKGKKLLKMNKAGIAKLFDQVGNDMDAELGLQQYSNSNDKADALMKMMADDPQNTNLFLSAIKQRGFLALRGKNNKMEAASEKDADEAGEALQKPLEQKNLLDALGVKFKAGKDGSLVEDRGWFYDPETGEGTGHNYKTYDSLESLLRNDVQQTLKGKGSQDIVDRWTKLAGLGQGQSVLAALDAEADQLTKGGKSKRNEKQLDEINAMRKSIQEKMGMASQNPMERLGYEIKGLLEQLVKKS